MGGQFHKVCLVRILIGYLWSVLLSWEADRPSDSVTLPFRNDQLIFRRHEIYLAYSAFSSLVEHGHNPEMSHLQTVDGSYINWESWCKPHSDDFAPVRCDADVALVGHSFGGATVVSLHFSSVFSYLSSPHLSIVLHVIEPASHKGIYSDTCYSRVGFGPLARAFAVSRTSTIFDSKLRHKSGANDTYYFFVGVDFASPG